MVLAGVGLLLIEAALPSFGAIGATGIIAFTAGGILLMKADIPGLMISPTYLALATLAGIAIVVGLVVLTISSQRKRVVSGKEGLRGQHGVVVSVAAGETYARVQGELWRVACKQPLSAGDSVSVRSVDGLTLHVERVRGNLA